MKWHDIAALALRATLLAVVLLAGGVVATDGRVCVALADVLPAVDAHIPSD